MFGRYHKFHMYSTLALIAPMIVSILLGIYAKSIPALTINITIKAFMAVIMFENMVFYYKILKTLKLVVDEISGLQVVMAILSYIIIFIALCFAGISTIVFGVLLVVGIAIRFIFKINQIDLQLGDLCASLDNEISLFNEEADVE